MGNSLSSDEITARLHNAVEKGDTKELRKWLNKGGDLNKLLETEQLEKPPSINPDLPVENVGDTSLERLVHTLATEEDEKSARTVSESDSKTSLRINALHRAASRKNNQKILQFVLNRVDDVDKQDSHGDTALHYVSMFHNNHESVALLMKFKPNINLQNDRGETALYSAVSRGCDLKIIEWLLKGGADPNICNIEGDTPLHVCALRRGVDPLIPGILLRFGANPNLKNKQGQTPLHVAAQTTNDAVLLLLKFNAKVRLRDNNGNRPSEVATSEEIKKVLLEEENDLLGKLSEMAAHMPDPSARTTRTSDIIETQEAAVFATAPPASAQSVQSWLNGQNSIDSASDFERTGSLRSDRGRTSQILYPRRSESGYSRGRASRMSVDSQNNKFSGGGGEGVIELPDNKEIVIPPDALPLGTYLKVVISSNDPDAPFPDLTTLDFKFDIKIQLPGKSLSSPWMGQENVIMAPPVFSGMCLEGETSWQCLRELGDETGTDSKLMFLLKKERCAPLSKRISRIEDMPSAVVDTPTPVGADETQKQSADESSNANDSDLGDLGQLEETQVGDQLDSLLSEKFWARQVVVVKEASDTSGSCDGSEVDSFGEDDLRQPVDFDDGAYIDYSVRMDELEENIRIQHPIDQELATITEEDGNPMESQEEEGSSRSQSDDFGENPIMNLSENNQLTKESSLSLDSGYRGSIDFEEGN